MTIAASIVLYHTPLDELKQVMDCLLQEESIKHVYLIDNANQKEDLPCWERTEYISAGKNLGYGRAHNIALRRSMADGTDYHLVVNADIYFQPNVLPELLQYMDKHPEAGNIMPKVVDQTGHVQNLCKLLPTPSDLFIRRFLPKNCCRKQRAQFLLDCNSKAIISVPYLSGCFMLLRTKALYQIGLFDERFFMYGEDIDLSRRIYTQTGNIYYPAVSITHQHKKGSYHSMRLFLIHIYNVILYFTKWGWWIDKERDEINQHFSNP